MMKTLEQIFLNIMRIQALPQNFENLKIGDVEKWDSLNHMLFLMEIESEYSLKFSVDEMGDLITIEQIRKAMEEK
tara:strand:- start:606 stop:830 length:225 start_codon:yes stop_codon:yes gene_type:complete